MISLLDIIPKYHVYIFDLWGVVHNGKDLFPYTLKTLEFLKKQGKYIALLSNSPRLVEDSKINLYKKGLTSDFYDILCTSGQHCHNFLKEAHFKKAFFIGPEHEKNILYGLDIEVAPCISNADFLLVTGLDGCKPDYFQTVLREAKNSSLKMICSNPDIEAILKDHYIFSAGSLAERYKNIGGEVEYFGKPHLSIYQFLFNKISENVVNLKKRDIICIGDSLLTDIKGANLFGVDSALVLSGIKKSSTIDAQTIPTYILRDISI